MGYDRWSKSLRSFKERVIMGLQDMILKKVLKVVDNTIGKKFKIVDEITDLFQGLQPDVEDNKEQIKTIKERLTKIEERSNENNNTK